MSPIEQLRQFATECANGEYPLDSSTGDFLFKIADEYENLHNLFAKYIDHVGACEGWVFIDHYFTEAEEKVLYQIKQIGHDKYGNHPYTPLPNSEVICDLIL